MRIFYHLSLGFYQKNRRMNGRVLAKFGWGLVEGGVGLLTGNAYTALVPGASGTAKTVAGRFFGSLFSDAVPAAAKAVGVDVAMNFSYSLTTNSFLAVTVSVLSISAEAVHNKYANSDKKQINPEKTKSTSNNGYSSSKGNTSESAKGSSNQGGVGKKPGAQTSTTVGYIDPTGQALLDQNGNPIFIRCTF